MKVGRHTKANALGVKSERPNIRELPVRRFERIGDIQGLVIKLFGASDDGELGPAPVTALIQLKGSTASGGGDQVSTIIRAMPFLRLAVADTPGPSSVRGYIERNRIALRNTLHSPPLDPPSTGWR